ncbi:MAG: ParB N-terminal domain-containing protein [Alphaproteobacteria bacterium]
MDSLLPFRNQARKTFDLQGISELALIIKEHVIRQTLTVVQSQDNKVCYEVISGERKLRATKALGLESVPCI